MIYFGYIQLPGRLGILQNLITNFNFLLIFSDQSFLDRISVLNQMTNQFYDFDLRGTQLTDKSISFFIFLQMGFIGLIFLFLIILVLVGRLFLGDFILPIAFLAIAYSDSFLYPSIIFFIFYFILDTLKKYRVLLEGQVLNMPLFSVITPINSIPDSFEDCCLSLMNQTLKDFEWIIVINGRELKKNQLENFVCNYSISDIKIIETNDSSGPSKARNLGINNSIGNYLVFLDSDDYLFSNFYAIFRE